MDIGTTLLRATCDMGLPAGHHGIKHSDVAGGRWRNLALSRPQMDSVLFYLLSLSENLASTVAKCSRSSAQGWITLVRHQPCAFTTSGVYIGDVVSTRHSLYPHLAFLVFDLSPEP